MAWKPQGGGPWGGGGSGGGGGGGPWGGGGGGQRGGGGPTPPDIEELLRKSQASVKRFMPGGVGGAKGVVLIVLLAVAVWLGSGFYKIEPAQEGVVLYFGKYWETTGPGLHYALPAPIGSVFKPEVRRVNRVEVGFRSSGTGNRGNQQVGNESLMLTGDENIINVQSAVFWIIKNSREFLFNVRNPELTVSVASQSAMREIIGKTEFEFARTKGRGDITAKTAKLIQEILDDYGAGIQITQVEIQGVEPPAAVIDAFKDVAAAKADKERAVNEATAYRNEITQRAEGQAAQVRAAAEAYKQETVATAEGETQRFISVFDEYKNDKEVTRRRLYLETMEEVLEGMDKVLLEKDGSGGGVVPYLPLDKLTRPDANAPSKVSRGQK